LGFGVWGLGSTVYGSGLRVSGLGARTVGVVAGKRLALHRLPGCEQLKRLSSLLPEKWLKTETGLALLPHYLLSPFSSSSSLFARKVRAGWLPNRRGEFLTVVSS